MMKLLSIALATAAFTVDAGTNKTLASTPANVIDSVLLPPLSSTTTMEADQPDLNSDEDHREASSSDVSFFAETRST